MSTSPFDFLSARIAQLRRFGLCGALSYIKGMLVGPEAEQRRFLRRNSRQYPFADPEPGITIVAPMTESGSLSKVMRDLAHSLKDAGIPFQTFDTNPHPVVPEVDVADIMTPRSEFKINRYSHILERIMTPVPGCVTPKRFRVVFWEFESGIKEGLPHILPPLGILGMSDFNADYFRHVYGRDMPVVKLLYPFRPEPCPPEAREETRRKFKLPPKDFIVFYNFNFASGLNRKNPIAAIKAFGTAFKDTPDARLVFKVMNSSAASRKHLTDIAEQMGFADRITIIDSYVTQKDLYSLTDACDVYLSLHRGEGFGLGIAEAMSLGKAVVVTDYSSTTEFCNPTNAIPVSFKLISPKPDQIDHPNYAKVRLWAEPDISDAAKALRRLYEDRELCKRLGESARKSILSQYSLANFRNSVLELING